MVHIAASSEFQFALIGFLLQAKQNLLSVAAEFDLSSGQAFSLFLMDTNRARSMKEYCQAYACDAGNLTGLIDGLEEKGLVVREQDQADRRIKVVRVLPPGAVLQQKLAARLAEVNAELFAPLSSDEQTVLTGMIQKIYSASMSRCIQS